VTTSRTTAQVAFAGREGLHKVVICMGTGCIANGAQAVKAAFTKGLREAGFETVESFDSLDQLTTPSTSAYLSQSGCQGFCQMGPLVSLLPEDILYTKVRPDDVPAIIERTIKNQELIEKLTYLDADQQVRCRSQQAIPFYRRQTRFVLKQCGALDPENLNEYIAIGGYEAAKSCWKDRTPEAICAEVLASGLRGRGGGGFPTGQKWELTRRQNSQQKYVICNGDEGDPGAFMDRAVMEGNPHSVIEGMMIAARAIGATAGFVYVRAEYPLAVERTRKACDDARAAGILGEDVFGTGCVFDVRVMEGAGAFVCGEETALIASLEGDRGMPAPKPPFPAQSGLWKRPTVINNVETLATVPLIVSIGAEAFREISTATSPGTKTFALSGHVRNTGLIEVPLGLTLREVVQEIGGGVIGRDGKVDPEGFKAVQIGGPSGGCLTKEHIDLPLDFDSLRGIGAMVGSGGLVVMNRGTCMVSIARYFMRFTQNESCGKCVVCREGTKQMLNLLDDIIEGRANLDTLGLLQEVAQVVQRGSLCGLGKTSPNPVLSTLKSFKDEYLAHVVEKRCPTGQCKALAKPEISPAKCKGCGACVKKCPVNAIKGDRKSPHQIDSRTCIKCGACATVCKFGAVMGI
jgi:NADH-quinone oxidoreductase subunit F